VEALKEELESLRRRRGRAFQVPPLEWIEERLTKLKDILERNSERSGLLLRKLLGPLRLEPTCAGDNDRPFYKATTSLNTLALVDPLVEGQGGKEVVVSSLTSIGELPTRRACQTNLAWGADDAAWARQAVDARRDFPSRYAGENEKTKERRSKAEVS